LIDDLIPGEARIFSWIEEVFSHGVRRPGYPADRWAEAWLQEQFREFGLENVRAEPVELPRWEPIDATLTVTASGETWEVPCFALPHTAEADELELPLAVFQPEDPARVRDSAALYDVRLNRVPHRVFKGIAKWTYDPADTFAAGAHILPFGREIMHVVEPAMEAGAAAIIGTLSGYPGNSCDYYVPYDAVERPIPAVWVNGSDGDRLRAMAAAGTTVRLTVKAQRESITSYNIVGQLEGADDESVIIGSHHDGPWASAVEDGSGIALVLAQAAYWSQVPVSQRPHRLVFLLNAGHMAGGAGQRTFVEAHGEELKRTVLELHLEHAANEVTDEGGEPRATGHPEVRWWFTSDLTALEGVVRQAIEREDLQRSHMLRPTTFGEKPTTDGADFYVAGVPIVHFLAAPWYLFDSADTVDKIHKPSLVPLTRAAIRIIEATAGVSAASRRSGLAP
jgi:hypothetical protein